MPDRVKPCRAGVAFLEGFNFTFDDSGAFENAFLELLQRAAAAAARNRFSALEIIAASFMAAPGGAVGPIGQSPFAQGLNEAV